MLYTELGDAVLAVLSHEAAHHAHTHWARDVQSCKCQGSGRYQLAWVTTWNCSLGELGRCTELPSQSRLGKTGN